MQSKRGWPVAVLTAGTLMVAACSSGGGHSRVQAPAGSGATAPSTVGGTTTGVAAASSTTASTSSMDATHIRALLVTVKDLPSGYAAAPDTEAGDDSVGVSPCGHLVLPVAGATAQARAVFDGNGNQQQVVEQVAALEGSGAAALVTQVRQVGGRCPQFDRTNAGTTVTLQITSIHPPAVGQEVAGVQLAYSARFFDLVVIRSGEVDAIVILSQVGNPVDPATMQAVVTAAGAKLTAGSGG